MYETILEQSLAGYWDWDIKTNKEYLSPAFKSMFGYREEEMENRPESWQRIIFQDDLPGVLKVFNAHVKSRGKIPYYSQVRYRHKNGSTVWVICTGKVIEWDGRGKPLRMVGCHIDITKLKAAEEAVKYRNKYLFSLWRLVKDKHESLRDTSDFILSEIKNLTGSEYAFYGFIDKKQKVMEVYSWSKNAMKKCAVEGKPLQYGIKESGIWADAVRKKKSVIINDYCSAFKGKKGIPQGHVPMKRVMSVPVIENGKVKAVGVVANKKSPYTAEDALLLETFMANAGIIAERKKQDEVVKKSYAELKKMDMHKTNFIAMISHELKTPLMAVSGFSELLKNGSYGKINRRQKEVLGIIMNNTKRQLSHVGELLDTSRIEAGKFSVLKKKISARSLTGACLAEMDNRLRESKTAVSVEGVADISCFADELKIKQVMQNIIANAINNRSEKPVLKISCRHVDELPAGVNGKKCRSGFELFEIRDNGTGINKQEIKRLFEKFYQAGMDKKLVNSGAGLGWA